MLSKDTQSPPGRTFDEIQNEIRLEQEKLKRPLSDEEQENILRRIIDLLNERKGAVYAE